MEVVGRGGPAVALGAETKEVGVDGSAAWPVEEDPAVVEGSGRRREAVVPVSEGSQGHICKNPVGVGRVCADGRGQPSEGGIGTAPRVKGGAACGDAGAPPATGHAWKPGVIDGVLVASGRGPGAASGWAVGSPPGAEAGDTG